MTASMVDGRQLTAIEQKIMLGYARCADIAAIAFAVGGEQERFGMLLLDLCHLNRQQAREIVRRDRTLPVHVERVVQPVGIVNSQRPHAARSDSPVPPAELQLLRMLATDLSLRAISAELGVTRNAARATMQRLYDRLSVSSESKGGARAAAVTLGRRLGLITDMSIDEGPADVPVSLPEIAPAASVEQTCAGTSAVQKERRKQTDAQWWASLTDEQRAKAVRRAVGPTIAAELISDTDRALLLDAVVAERFHSEARHL